MYIVINTDKQYDYPNVYVIDKNGNLKGLFEKCTITPYSRFTGSEIACKHGLMDMKFDIGICHTTLESKNGYKICTLDEDNPTDKTIIKSGVLVSFS